MHQPRLAITATRTTAEQASSRAASRVQVVDAVEAQRQITDRDHTLLTLLADHQVLTTEQIARTLFASDNVARKRLVLLTRRGVLARFRSCTRPGSQSWRYTLGPLGAMVHAASTGTATIPTAAKTYERTLKLARSPRLAHLLGVNEFFTRLAAHARANPEYELVDWLSERHATAACARIVHPDGYGTWRDNNHDIGFFLEYDTGTEKLDTVTEKLTGYRELADAGISHPALFVFPGAKRENNFHDKITRNTPALYRLPVASTTIENLAHTTPASRVWLAVGAPARCDLTHLPGPRAA
ncbi:MAG: hypothetical protein GEV07_05365 [Streptosporangiales bacterium]|nr:hypothetical protein [Streptosporangiales bacterium]